MIRSILKKVLLAGILASLNMEATAEDRCLTCHKALHPAIVQGLSASAHHELTSCSSCHGVSNSHMAGPRKSSSDQPFEPGTAGRDQVCLSCHQSSAGHWAGSSHSQADLGCNDCHRVHDDSKTALRAGTRTCLSCHAAVNSSLHLPSRHPIAEGETGCVDCHDPHGSMNVSDLRGFSLNDSCLSCHEPLRGPFLFEHQPVSEDCSLCHQPHGSVHKPLLRTRGPLLCQQCHMANFHPSQLQQGAGLAGKNCLNCHPKVHGSNHPSGARLTR